MIKKASANMLPRLKRIWQGCFEESKEATDFVFENLLGPDQMLVEADENDRPIAMLNWKMLRFATPKKSLAGAYIYGVATLPEHRGKGISTALLEHVGQLFEEGGISLACLVPAQESLLDFYAGRGFEPRFYYKLVSLSREEIPAPSREGALSVAELDELEPIREKAFAGRALFGGWDTNYLKYVSSECRFLGGEVLRFACGGNVGYAVCYPQKSGAILVKEAVATGPDLNVLLAALDKRYGAPSYQLRLPADFEFENKWTVKIVPFGAVKWYNKESEGALTQGGAPWFAFGLDS